MMKIEKFWRAPFILINAASSAKLYLKLYLAQGRNSGTASSAKAQISSLRKHSDNHRVFKLTAPTLWSGPQPEAGRVRLLSFLRGAQPHSTSPTPKERQEDDINFAAELNKSHCEYKHIRLRVRSSAEAD